MLGEVSGIQRHGVLRSVDHETSGQKWTHLDTMLLILRVLRITGFTYVNSSDDCPEKTGLEVAVCKVATGTVSSVARRHAFRRRRPLPFPAGCSRQGAEVTFKAPNASSGRT